MRHIPISVDREALENAVCEALKFAQTQPYGDLAMDANRAAAIAVSAIDRLLMENYYAIFPARDVDYAINGDGQEAWAATGRVIDILKELAVRRTEYQRPEVKSTVVFPEGTR